MNQTESHQTWDIEANSPEKDEPMHLYRYSIRHIDGHTRQNPLMKHRQEYTSLSQHWKRKEERDGFQSRCYGTPLLLSSPPTGNTGSLLHVWLCANPFCLTLGFFVHTSVHAEEWIHCVFGGCPGRLTSFFLKNGSIWKPQQLTNSLTAIFKCCGVIPLDRSGA